MNLAYANWLDHALRLAETETAASEFDLVHLITYVGWRFSGNFYRLCLLYTSWFGDARREASTILDERISANPETGDR